MTQMMVPLLSGGALAGLAFLAILVFGLLAVVSLTRHIRRSRTPWAGEVDGAIPLNDRASRTLNGTVAPLTGDAVDLDRGDNRTAGTAGTAADYRSAQAETQRQA